MNEPTDADLIAAIGRGIAAGTIIECTEEWVAAQRAALDTEDDTEEDGAAETIAVGPITLELDADPGYHAEQWWGVNPHDGNAVFVSRNHPEHLVLPGEKGNPWTAMLWIGWEDGAGMGNHPANEVHYATREDAVAAIRRRCAGWYRYLGDHASAAEYTG